MDKVTNFSPKDKRWYSLEDFEGEIWKAIEGFEGKYLVSNYGRVKTLYQEIPCLGKNSTHSHVVVKEKIKRYTDNGHGYLFVSLSKDNKPFQQYIHRLVATAFIPNPLNMPQVNHRDEDKSNNSVINLEWCTPAYNNNYGTLYIRASKTLRENGNTRQIDMYDLNGNFLKHYDCALDMEKDGLSRRQVYNVCYGRSRSYKNCVFRFTGQSFSYRKKEKRIVCKKEVIEKDKYGNILRIYNSIKEAEKENGLGRNYLYSATYASTRTAIINEHYFEIIKYNK